MFLALALLACQTGTPDASHDPVPAPPERPWDVVLVISDALRAANLPLYGYPRDTTPALSALAETSLVIEHAVAQFPGTPQSVSQLFTGHRMPPLLMGTRLFAIPSRGIPDNYPVLPRVFNERGYHTALVSSHPWWTDDSRLLPLLDEVHIVPSEQSYAPFPELHAPIQTVLETAGDAPLFLTVHSMDTHGPWADPDPNWVSSPLPPEYAAYDTDIRRTDTGVARLIEALKAAGRWERTVFVFTSDHGEEFGELGPEPWNRNHGLQVRRPLNHVPLIVRLPTGRHGRLPDPVGLVDLTPTLVQLATGAPLQAPTDGRDLADDWLAGRGSGADHRPVVHSWRWWASVGAEDEVHWDPWEGLTTVHTVTADAHNYPRLGVGEPATPEDAAHLRQMALQSLTAFQALPSATLAPGESVLALPMRLAEGSARPRFEGGVDNRWTHNGQEIRLEPGERAPPLRLAFETAPGPTRMALKVPLESVGELRVGVNHQAPVAVTAEGTRVDLGTHTLGATTTLTLDAPRGGVVLYALLLTPDGSEAAPNTELSERLRALGYTTKGAPESP